MILGLFAGFAVLAITFLINETRVEEPIISYSLFKNRLYTTSILCALFSGAAFIVASVYIPIFIQGCLGVGNKLRARTAANDGRICCNGDDGRVSNDEGSISGTS